MTIRGTRIGNTEIQRRAGNVSTSDSSLETAMVPSDPGSERLPVEQAFRRYHGGLVNFLRRRMRSEEDAADVAQETYVRLMQSYEHDLLPETAATLIFRIAANVANDFSRRRKSHHVKDHCPVELTPLASGEPSHERRLHASQQLERLYAAIEGLSPRCQQVFLLNRVDRMTYTQIARHCGISTSMVEKHITKALATLREKVGDIP